MLRRVYDKIKSKLLDIKELIRAQGPKIILYFGIAWLITNGWAYLLLGFGLWLDIGWLTAIAGAYIGFLWLPCTPEKVVTLAITYWLMRRYR